MTLPVSRENAVTGAFVVLATALWLAAREAAVPGWLSWVILLGVGVVAPSALQGYLDA